MMAFVTAKDGTQIYSTNATEINADLLAFIKTIWT